MSDIKQKAQKMFDEKFGSFEFKHKSGNIWNEDPFKDFIDSIIDLAIAEERKRVVEMIKMIELSDKTSDYENTIDDIINNLITNTNK